MRELKFPCTCSSTTERFRCKENCDHATQRHWIEDNPPKWIVFREFYSEEEAMEARAILEASDHLCYYWQIEKR
jgi:hypothetical protein